jgi:hypothetical protein
MRVHLPERFAHLLRDRVQGPQVGAQGDEVGDGEQDRGQDERPVILRCEDDRHDEEDERADHQVDTGAEQVVHFANIVGGARHGIAHRLQTVEGHALAEQGQVQFVADVALDLLRHQLRAEVSK